MGLYRVIKERSENLPSIKKGREFDHGPIRAKTNCDLRLTVFDKMLQFTVKRQSLSNRPDRDAFSVARLGWVARLTVEIISHDHNFSTMIKLRFR
jgi:hypothetical protein